MSGSSMPLNMSQIKADLFMAKAAMNEASGLSPKAAKYIKGQAAYHLQQASEKMIKIQMYYSGITLDMHKMYKHPLGDLISYAASLSINLSVPEYVLKNRLVISSWEAEGRYDVHMTVKQPQLEKCYTELDIWFAKLKKAGYK